MKIIKKIGFCTYLLQNWLHIEKGCQSLVKIRESGNSLILFNTGKVREFPDRKKVETLHGWQG